MNEAETRAELIDPTLRDAGWGLITILFSRKWTRAAQTLTGGQVIKQALMNTLLNTRE